MDRRKQQQINRARERKLRAKYRRNIRTAVVITLIIALAGGFYLGYKFGPQLLGETETGAPVAAPTATPEITLAPTAEPTADPTAVPTAEPTAEPTATPEPAEIMVPVGASQNFSAQINNDGTVRKTNDTTTYETLNFTLRVLRYLTPEYYQETYSSRYRMQGNEAGVEFELTLNDYMGSQTIVPQELFTVGLESATGISEQGYQLTNAEIQGDKVVITTNIPTIAYKRFVFSESVGDMKYLTVTTTVDGVAHTYKFELDEPIRSTPEPTAEPTPMPTFELLEIGSRGDAVTELQQALIDQGYLEGSADGRFGAMTSAAIKAAQAEFGMEETGVADNAFQQRLYFGE